MILTWRTGEEIVVEPLTNYRPHGPAWLITVGRPIDEAEEALLLRDTAVFLQSQRFALLPAVISTDGGVTGQLRELPNTTLH